ncbi:hypothetical protein C8J56DRAFT_462555 [Mycena floridula]|nr:hypothetical protein C8J56DRAFT_462555 [Mycena floridula]
MSVVQLDDNDSSIIYSADPLHWGLGGGPEEYDGTTHGTTTLGASAQIPFSGTYIKVYGTVTAHSSPDPVSSYSIDDGPATTFSPDSSTISADAHKLLFFQSGTLAAGDHKLVIKMMVDGGRYYLDWVEFTPQGASASTGSGGTLGSSGGDSGTTGDAGSSGDSANSGVSANKGTITTTILKSTTSTVTTADSKTTGTHPLSQSGTKSTSTPTSISTQSLVSLAVADPSNTSTGLFATSLPNATETVTITGTSSKAPIGAIVGAIVGAICVMVLAFLLYRYKMKTQKHRRLVVPEPYPDSLSSPRLASTRESVVTPHIAPSPTYVTESTSTTTRSEKSPPSIQPEEFPPAYYQAVLQDSTSTAGSVYRV